MVKSINRKSSNSRSASRQGKRRTTVRPGARKTASPQRSRPGAAIKLINPTSKDHQGTKQIRIIMMLRAPSGATLDAIMRATGWQQHSVRGFLAAVVRKKLGLDLLSEIGKSGRVYRIVDREASHSAKPNTAA
jgi:hypothetical protein